MNTNKTLTFFAVATAVTLTILGIVVIVANLFAAGEFAALMRGSLMVPRTPGFLGIAMIGAAGGALLFMSCEQMGKGVALADEDE